MVMGAGALQPLGVRQVATPLPCRPPNTTAIFTIDGITALHFASARILVGIALSGVAIISSRTLAAVSRRFLMSVSAFESFFFSNLAVFSDFSCCDGLGLAAGFETVVVDLSSCDQPSVAIMTVMRQSTAVSPKEKEQDFLVIGPPPRRSEYGGKRTVDIRLTL